MKKGTKENTPVFIHSFAEVDHALLLVGRSKALIQHHESVMNDEIQKVRDRFQEETATAQAEIVRLSDEIERFCTLNKNEFELKRSREMVHGTVGFRTTPPSVRQLNRKYNWATVLELLKKFTWSRRQFVRTTEEVDKEAILAAYSSEEVTDERLASVGLKIDKTEEFTLEVKWDAIGES